MTNQSRRESVITLLAQLFGRTIPLSAEFCRESEPDWDSIRHLELVFALEDEFNVRFSPNDIQDLDSAKGIVHVLERYLDS